MGNGFQTIGRPSLSLRFYNICIILEPTTPHQQTSQVKGNIEYGFGKYFAALNILVNPCKSTVSSGLEMITKKCFDKIRLNLSVVEIIYSVRYLKSFVSSRWTWND